ncbi:MAG TPA: DUF2934 domain-containing protein [Alphaproteobacteria bacterium]|nr:DUF2934 domain-containing protein [Alphaproteobacteria bacterium]
MDERISKRAYELWEKEGRPDGRAQHHWEEARRQIEAEDAQASPAEKAIAATRRAVAGEPTAGREATHAEESAMPAAAPTAEVPAGVPGMTAMPIVPEAAIPAVAPPGEPSDLQGDAPKRGRAKAPKAAAGTVASEAAKPAGRGKAGTVAAEGTDLAPAKRTGRKTKA